MTRSPSTRACFASAFDSEAWGELAGFWHDLGKYADDFQSYLRSPQETPGSKTPRSSMAGRVDGSTTPPPGRFSCMNDPVAISREWGAVALAMVIAGHHSGLPTNKDFEDERLEAEGSDPARGGAKGGRRRAILSRELPPCRSSSALRHSYLSRTKIRKSLRYEFWTRMLFSTLIDADRLDTERFMNEKQAADRDRSRSGQNS